MGDGEGSNPLGGGSIKAETSDEALARARRIAGRVLAREDVRDAHREQSLEGDLPKPSG